MKIKLFLVGAFVLLVSIFWQNAIAKEGERTIPEEDGIYDVVGRPDLKVRVFVYKEKGVENLAKPAPQPQPSPICGLSDLDSQAIVGATGWQLPSSVTYYLNPSSAPIGFRSDLSLISSRSFSVWVNGLNNSPVSVFEASQNTLIDRASLDGKNIIAWGRTSPSALAVTYTWYNKTTGLAVETDTIMNKKVIWSWTPYDSSNLCSVLNTYDAQDILTHELGHWFGLIDHYTADYVENTMYGYGSKAEIKKDTLTIGDLTGLQLIY